MQKAPVMKGSGLAPVEDSKSSEVVHVFGKNLEERVVTPTEEQEQSTSSKIQIEDHEKNSSDDIESIRKRKFEAVTGEEEEETVFQGDFKLFVWDLATSNWIEKGRGQLKLNDSIDPDHKRYRLIMRLSGTLRIILNVAIKSSFFKVVACTKTNIRFTDSQTVWAASGPNTHQLKALIEDRLKLSVEDSKDSAAPKRSKPDDEDTAHPKKTKAESDETEAMAKASLAESSEEKSEDSSKNSSASENVGQEDEKKSATTADTSNFDEKVEAKVRDESELEDQAQSADHATSTDQEVAKEPVNGHQTSEKLAEGEEDIEKNESNHDNTDGQAPTEEDSSSREKEKEEEDTNKSASVVGDKSVEQTEQLKQDGDR